MTHTPAPWNYRPTNSGHMISGGKPGYLAEIRDCGSGDVVANARLIAAAPDLLAALRDLVAYCESVGMADAFNRLPPARSAIARAIGTGNA